MKSFRERSTTNCPYGEATFSAYTGLAAHAASIPGARGAVYGTVDAWVEGSLFALGARSVLTVEYRRLRPSYPGHTTVTPAELAETFLNGTMPEVDFAVSFSRCVCVCGWVGVGFRARVCGFRI